jgi:hypothetical protein
MAVMHRFLSFFDNIFYDFLTAQQPLVGQGLFIVETTRSHSDTPHSVGLWTIDQPNAETSA